VRSIKFVIVDFEAFEKVKLYKADWVQVKLPAADEN
jgi:hypothetical protein